MLNFLCKPQTHRSSRRHCLGRCWHGQARDNLPETRGTLWHAPLSRCDVTAWPDARDEKTPRLPKRPW
ncbi:hypothetical protein NDU88_000845 [Pleurodeles waltl]|uniref:Uncharacterized protein n=1 Tax=Pleurodeles waltl TaxID=8319 RepID=A0AAV7N975_PLEWA|nr:hypothetical protein NDU88_000845 [Pleurodeles waltl]